ncbi:tRNA lysidine(34) synthetase TilS [Flavobacterium sp.]|uniref:tRNA lysidine(34) synthetase TilS n=1 Tax=Flavobacterium sp. TaxID=239 RepID=UPI0034525F1A
MMITKLRLHLTEYFPFLTHKRVLLAVSGGIDSMVMADLFSKLPFEMGIAHCNFGLRFQESDADEALVQSYAEKIKVPYFFERLDAQRFADDYKVSIQMAARQLRYNWFQELLETKHFDYVLTAHHLNDSLETFLINFSRGTGPDGLVGIPPQNGNVIRPLLPFSRGEIEKYARINSVPWREDSSNASDKYMRNKLRHQIVPVLKEINPSFLNAFQYTSEYLRQKLSMADDAARIVYRKVVSDDAEQKKINLKELLVLPNYKSYLQHWLQPLGFTAWNDIYELVNAQSGKQVFSSGFRLIKDRECLLLAPIAASDQLSFLIEKGIREVKFPLKLSFCKVADKIGASNTVIFVDEDLLGFPLMIRKWEEGDRFQPIGMAGQSKKVSKYFKDEKFSAIEKEQAWLLCTGTKVIWIIGRRQDDRFKVTPNTKNILQIKLDNET